MGRPFFIAEISSNHIMYDEVKPDLARAKALIDATKQIGADAVKFQLFEIDRLFASEILENSPQHRERVKWQLPRDFIPELATHAKAQGLAFSCTAFDIEALHFIAPLVDFFKIASYELLWHDLLAAALTYNKQIWLSTGMANMQEIEAALNFAYQHDPKANIGLMHCVSAYPTPIEACNLKAIQTMREAFNLPIGWSDHSKREAVILSAALKYDAAVIEFHLDHDGKGAEFAPGHCWLAHEIVPLITIIQQAELAEGTGLKQPVPCEIADREWRADPSDGLRPLLAIRKSFLNP